MDPYVGGDKDYYSVIKVSRSTVYCTVNIELLLTPPVYSVHRTVYSVQYTMYSVQCTLYTVLPTE